ncbi:hypothetical protein [Tardiphaga sp. 42S5]|uniref:hypothetical protein n=1 Tax=Tardiphaga sp. 42S5 TaxID=1404799 RepID=UPI002A5A997D|nr:hypothetical protein [Tardiphaga sp. 42S5]WPO42529.1 hypothetical protein SFY93_05060 [Tardiphaga sp. 42S5]
MNEILQEASVKDDAGSDMIFEELRTVTNRQWRELLRTLDGASFAKIEARANALILDGLRVAESRAPGQMADRLIALGDLHTDLFMGVPAHMIGGKDLLDLAAEHGNSSLYTIQGVIWPKYRQHFRWHLGNYFSRVAAGETGMLQRLRREVRVVHLAGLLRLLFGPRGLRIEQPSASLQ